MTSDNNHRAASIEDTPLRPFHIKLALYSSGGPFIDGYAIAVIGVALITLSPALNLSSWQEGIISASILVGIFVGGLAFGYVTDKVGRQIMYIINLSAMAIVCILTAFATDIWQIVALRFILGVAIGADYPVASSLLAEFSPRKYRGTLLGSLFVVWAAGAAVAYIVGYAFQVFGSDAWRWLLASPAVFAVVTLVLRLGTPESPRWLLSKGKVDRARQVLQQVYGNSDISALEHEQNKETRYRSVFSRAYRKRMVFMVVFWTAQIIPLVVIYSYVPGLLGDLGVKDYYLVSTIIAVLFVVGGIPGLWLVEAIGRRNLVVWSFAVIAVALIVPGVVPNFPTVGFLIALGVFALASGASNFLELVYPNELFPTEVRATAVGVGTASSRIGSAIGAYIMPAVISLWGVAGALLISGVVCLIGFAVSLVLAPETRGKVLHEVADVGTVDPQVPQIHGEEDPSTKA